MVTLNSEEQRQSAPRLIVHIIHRLAVGGLENGLVNLLNRLPDNGCQHAIISLTDATDFGQRINRPGVQIFTLNKKPGKDLGMYWRLWKLLRRLRPDIVHTRNLSTIDASVIAKFAGVPLRIHGEHGRDVNDIDGRNRKYRLIRRFCSYFINRYIALSKDLGAWLERDIQVRPDKIEQIYNGVDHEKFHPTRPDEHGLVFPFTKPANGNIIFATIGRLETVKDQLNLLQALAWLKENEAEAFARCRTVIVGDGSLRATLDQFIADHDLQDTVVMAGNRDDVADILRAIDVFVLPSKAEGISNTILEAMATGLPVVATEVGGNPELVLQNETGLLVNAENPQALARALKVYIDTPALIKSHGAAARVRVENRFKIELMVRNYHRVYSAKKPIALVGPHPPPAGGMANQTVQLSKLLRAEGNDVELVQTNASYRPQWIAKVKGLRAFFRLFFYLIALWRTAGRVRLFHVMANSGWAWHFFAAPAIVIAKLRGVPTIVNYRGGNAKAFFERWFWVVNLTLSKADHVVVPSAFLTDIFAAHGVRTEIVPNIVDLECFFAPHSAHRPKKLFVARNLEGIYGIDTLIRAFSQLAGEFTDLELVIAGSGPEEAALKALAGQLDLRSRVHFTGKIDHEHIVAYYHQSLVAVNPSRVDNMPNSVLEALACKVPVVSTNVGGVPYMVKNEETALLVDADDDKAMANAIRRLINDETLRKKLKNNGWNSVQQYAWPQVKRQWYQLYSLGK